MEISIMDACSFFGAPFALSFVFARTTLMVVRDGGWSLIMTRSFDRRSSGSGTGIGDDVHCVEVQLPVRGRLMDDRSGSGSGSGSGRSSKDVVSRLDERLDAVNVPRVEDFVISSWKPGIIPILIPWVLFAKAFTLRSSSRSDWFGGRDLYFRLR
jgi:hypothetical protein